LSERLQKRKGADKLRATVEDIVKALLNPLDGFTYFLCRQNSQTTTR